MERTADAVVIGGGVNGTSVAFHLAHAGMTDVVLVERAHLAAGATGKSGALVRMHYNNLPETQLAYQSLRYFQHWDDMVGGDCGFEPVGTVIFAPQEHRPQMEAILAIQDEVGVSSRMVTPEEAKEIDPSVHADEADVIAYEPDSGYADPHATTFGFAKAAETMGVTVMEDTQALRILTEGDRVTGVATSRGVIQTERVVVVAGAWANQLFEPLGVDLGVYPRQSRIAIFRWSMDRSPQHPTYIDKVNRTWIRPIHGSSTLGGAEFGERAEIDPANYPESVTQDYIDLVRRQLSQRLPSITRSTSRGNWACALMGSPDSRPLIGGIDQYAGLYTITGDSGTSFKTAPAIGKGLSELILDGKATTVDLYPFRPSRFAEGAPWVDDYDYDLENASVSR